MHDGGAIGGNKVRQGANAVPARPLADLVSIEPDEPPPAERVARLRVAARRARFKLIISDGGRVTLARDSRRLVFPDVPSAAWALMTGGAK